MTISKHATKTSHRRTERRVLRREIREQLSECPALPSACKGVKK